jgi:hypothetical protein
MTRWGLLLLLIYLVLGLSPVGRVKAARLAAGLTAIVIAIVMARAGALH